MSYRRTTAKRWKPARGWSTSPRIADWMSSNARAALDNDVLEP